MKILVTGATGFVGNYVIEELLSRGHEVIATSTSEEKAKAADWFSRVKYLPYDLAEAGQNNIFEYFEKPDLLIHLAWSGLPNYKAFSHISENLVQQLGFLKRMIDGGLKDLAVTGTCFEYGMQSGPLAETMLPLPSNPYAIAKDSLRVFLEAYMPEKKFHLKWIRLFYMYGKGQNPKSIIPLLEESARKGEQVFRMSAGEQLRDYLPIEKVADNIVTIATQQNVEGIINCCSGVPVSVRKLIENHIEQNHFEIEPELGYYPYPDYEPMAFWGDASKLNSIRGSEAQGN